VPQEVRFGLVLSNRAVLLGMGRPEDLFELAESGESSGLFDHVWVGDSILAKPRIESVTLLAGIAARTRRVKLGVACMASLPSRDPILLAHQWASLDVLSQGRTLLGACLGGGIAEQAQRTEYRNLGIDASQTTLNDLNGRPQYIVEDDAKPLPELV
jgi:alkanesulfonate monooxygenase SsuD/methylene tetrahydromethanopterin reductase-like flavin-dependent oxidoreductase (luciferase family)